MYSRVWEPRTSSVENHETVTRWQPRSLTFFFFEMYWGETKQNTWESLFSSYSCLNMQTSPYRKLFLKIYEQVPLFYKAHVPLLLNSIIKHKASFVWIIIPLEIFNPAFICTRLSYKTLNFRLPKIIAGVYLNEKYLFSFLLMSGSH